MCSGITQAHRHRHAARTLLRDSDAALPPDRDPGERARHGRAPNDAAKRHAA